ncbi:MAG: TatD family hydrolase [Patescibacteria group bacterium]
MLIDTHAHLTDNVFEKDLEGVLDKAYKAGVLKIITVGTNLLDSEKALKLAEKYEGVFAAVGVYPDENIENNPHLRDRLDLLAKNSKVIAIGECGLDYLKSSKTSKDEQNQKFRMQVGKAVELNLPLIIHNRNADEDILKALSYYESTKRLRGVMHCFTGSVAFAEKVVALGLYISFTGILTYQSGKNLEDVVKSIPRDRVLVETDSPYLAPEKLKGTRNEPANVVMVANKLSHIWGVPPKEAAGITTKNAQILFEI